MPDADLSTTPEDDAAVGSIALQDLDKLGIVRGHKTPRPEAAWATCG
jgi:hypothetical protein